MKINIVNVKRVLAANDTAAKANRDAFENAGILAVNLISAPGSGKTTLLEKTIPVLAPEHKSIVVVGDLQTTRDAERVAHCAEQVTQINTGFSCHIYANQVTESLEGLKLHESDFLFVENVGNMVCPGEFDLGENLKVVLYSIPEGDDKAAKYPTIFRAADLVLLTKYDLIKVLDFDIHRVKEDIAKLNSQTRVLPFSSFSKEGMTPWVQWLHQQKGKCIGAKAKFVAEE